MTDLSLGARLKERARSLGLGPVGFAAIAPSEHAAALRAWIARGRHASMTWMERTAQDSIDLTRRFAWARSAVVVAQPYLPYRSGRDTQPGLLPHIARYAVGRDYHRTLRERLEALASFLGAESPGAQCRVYVDTGPILERELAVRAGLGWFGKSTNLIAPRGNSWILLGQILTSVVLEPDAQAPDRCGSCTACIDACPTQAITEPYGVDSARCISYTTIELKGPIELERHTDLGEWVFGCDICQEVCPWNRKVDAIEDPAFLPGEAVATLSLAGLTALDETRHAALFGATALARPQRSGLVRNALIVAANTGNDAALANAGAALADPDPTIRVTAAQVLSHTGGSGARRAVARARDREPDTALREHLERTLD